MAQIKRQKTPTPTEDKKQMPRDEASSILSSDQQETVHELANLGTNFFDGLVKLNQEMLSFYSDRALQDMELQRELLGCTKFSDALDVQSRFLQKTAQQYSDEASRLLELSNELVPDELNPMGNQLNS